MPARRILHVINSLDPAEGGPPEGLRQLATNYRAIGSTVEVATCDSPEMPFLRDAPFPVHALGPRVNPYGVTRQLFPFLRSQARNYDLVVINGIWLFHAAAAAAACKLTKTPYVVFTHGALDLWFRRRYPLKHLKKMAYWPIQYSILKGAKNVLFTSRDERDASGASFWPNKWNGVVVPYGTNPPAGTPETQIASFLERVPEVRGKRFLLFLSRIHEKKGIDLLISAFAKVAPEHPELCLVVAGPDQVGLARLLKAQAERCGVGDRIFWPGMLSGDAKYGAFRAADAFVLPSHQENFGIVVAESLACGTPVLISNKVNIWKDILAQGCGIVREDTEAGVRCLLSDWLHLSPAAASAMRREARHAFDKHYSMRRTAEVIVRILGDTADVPPGREQSEAPVLIPIKSSF